MATHNKTTEPTNILTFFWWLVTIPLKFIRFFSALTHQYPDDESGLLMQRFMAPKSWFDHISHWWVKQSFFTKSLFGLSTILVSACLGIIAGAITLCTLSAGFFFIMSHTLLLLHETSRREGVHLFAKESLALNEDLRSCKQLLNDAIQNTQKITEQLHQKSEAITLQIDSFDTESKFIEQCHNNLTTEINTVTEETTKLVRQEHLITDEFKTISADLVQCGQAINQTTETLISAGESMTQFSNIVSEALKAQEKWSQATHQFNFFVREQSLGKTPSPVRNDGFLNQLQVKNTEDDHLIAAWKQALTI